ncbi:MAG TPA: Gfo/Idh/MocA family oxidoreductase [Pyrinomonadaceae bacterium]|nr:Gfo/Idh/MocA family oxidoreductase [Pyrinomonadaceae bacterium]
MIHLGIIGGGNISATHARAASEIGGLKIAAVYGTNHEKCTRLTKEYGATAYADLDNFLKHRPLDLVAIGSPSGLHAEQGIAAARSGLHVLVEKPLDITTERADALIAECERANVKLGVFFQDRVAPELCRLKDLIDTGVLGKPILATAQVKWFRPPEYYGSSRWRGTWALDGGGALINQGVHTLDLLLWLLGDITRVSAMAITALHNIEVEDTLVATLEFANGALGTLEASTAIYPGYPRRLELCGSAGTIIVEQNRIIAANLRNSSESVIKDESHERNPSSTSPVVSNVSGHRRILEDFLLAIETNSIPRCNGWEGRRSLEVVQAIYESSRRGQPVQISVVSRRQDQPSN